MGGGNALGIHLLQVSKFIRAKNVQKLCKDDAKEGKLIIDIV